MSEPNYVVIRAENMNDGVWVDLSRVRMSGAMSPRGAVAEPTGRFEVDEAGAVAEVYEVRP